MVVELMKDRRLSFDAFSLKLIAIIAMFIDHAGCIFFDNFIPLRIIGRITIPIMAFFITEGYRKTRNIKKYMLRLALFAVISMLPYHLAFASSYFNIIFNLLFGLITLYITDKLQKEWQKWTVVIIFAGIAFSIGCDGIFTTVPLIYLMNKYRGNFKKMFISTAILLFGISFVQIIIGVTGIDRGVLTSIYTWIRPFALLSFIFIYRYNGQKGRSAKYLFYIFYPAHLLVFCLINLYISH